MAQKPSKPSGLSTTLVLLTIASWDTALSQQVVPGGPSAVLFHDDWSSTALRNFPAKLTRIAGDMAVVEDRGQRFLQVSTSGSFEISLSRPLPAAYTIEFDMLVPSSTGYSVEVRPDAPGSAAGYADLRRRTRNPVVHCGAIAAGVYGSSSEVSQLTRFPDSLAKQLTRCQIEVTTGGVKVYFGQRLAANAPGVSLGSGSVIRWHVPAGPKAEALIGPIRVTGPSPQVGAQPMIGGTNSAAPTSINADPKMTAVTLSWAPVQGAIGYTVARAPSASGPYGLLTPTPITATTFTDQGLWPGTAYAYQVRVELPDKTRATSAPVSVTTTPPPNPTNFKAVAVGGTVTLSWDKMPGAVVYRIQGSGLEPKNLGSTGYTVVGLQPGSHSYQLIAYYSVGGQEVADEANPARATVSVDESAAYPPGKYRISITGFTVNHESEDDLLELDGKGDEVYFSVQLLKSEPNGQLNTKESRLIQSTVFGDKNGFPGRTAAGSRSNLGGLKTGDQFRLPTPLLLWEGQLSGGLLVTPTVWEWDGTWPDHLRLEQAWTGVMKPPAGAVLSQFGHDAGPSSFARAPFLRVAGYQELTVYPCVGCFISEDTDMYKCRLLCGDPLHPVNRPIGVNMSSGFRPGAIRLGQGTLEAALAGKISMEFPVQYQDYRKGSGDYTILVRFERIK